MTTLSARKIPLPALAQMWGWSQQKLYHLCRLQRIPHARIGREIFFDAVEIAAWYEAQTRRPDPAPAVARPTHRGRTADEECAAFGIHQRVFS